MIAFNVTDAEICVTFCVTRTQKMGRFVITREECNNYSSVSKRHLRTADDIGRFLQKCRFALRKPPFYPLNYGTFHYNNLHLNTGFNPGGSPTNQQVYSVHGNLPLFAIDRYEQKNCHVPPH